MKSSLTSHTDQMDYLADRLAYVFAALTWHIENPEAIPRYKDWYLSPSAFTRPSERHALLGSKPCSLGDMKINMRHILTLQPLPEEYERGYRQGDPDDTTVGEHGQVERECPDHATL